MYRTIFDRLRAAALKMGACALASQTEGDRLARLAFTPQGLEFCSLHDWPTLEDIKEIKPEERERLGFLTPSPSGGKKVFDTRITDICIIGPGRAILDCPVTSEPYHILCLDGADVTLSLRNYAVAAIYRGGSAKVQVIPEANSYYRIFNP